MAQSIPVINANEVHALRHPSDAPVRGAQAHG
jgi:hypothetical protein